MKKHLFILSLTILTAILLSCNNSNNKVSGNQYVVVSFDNIIIKEQQTEKLDSIVDLIVSISANDFNKNQQPAPVDFKNVNFKYIKKANGEELYILCEHLGFVKKVGVNLPATGRLTGIVS